MTTPKEITTLEANQIFVFGSNLNGNHTGGAALQAKQWGAVDGQGEGLQGQTYAFPTLDTDMQKVAREALLESKERLYQCANENKDKQFLVTKVGCGIAGFTEDQMKDVFKGEKPENVILPAGWAIVRGYKAFDKGLVCRGFQYELGKDFYHEGEIGLCSSGFHFCKSLGNVYSFYDFDENKTVVAEIESEGDVIDDEQKSVTNHLRIVRILGWQEAMNNSGVKNVGHSNTGNRNTGNWNTGHWNTGNGNTGHWNTGNSNTGDWNTGNRNTGNGNTGHCNTGNWNTGNGNTGDCNTGHCNTGHRNTGDRNTGNSNTGDWNTGHWNTGFFNNTTPEDILVFGKSCKRYDFENCDKPNFIYFETKKYISFDDMTDEEKEQYPQAKYQGGYIKDIPYKEAFIESYNNASQEDKDKIKNIPNFDADIFFDISGIRIN